MADCANARFLSDVLESAMSKILEQDVTHFDCRDEQVGESVVVNISKGGCHADSVIQPDSRQGSDIFKLAMAKVAPKLIAAKLVDKIDVEQTITVHVGDRQTRAVIVMDRLVVLCGVIDDMVFETDAAFLVMVRELKVVK